VTLSLCLPIYAKHAKAEARSKEDVLGVMAVDVPVSLLSQIIMAMKPLPHSYSIVLGRRGSYIVHPDTKTLMKQETVFDVVENGADISVREAAETMLAGETGYKSFRKDGEDWYVFYKPFLRSWSTKAAELGTKEFGIPMDKQGWSAGLVYLEDDIVGEYHFLVFLVLAITIVGVLVFFFLCRMVVRQQMRPLRMLNKSAQRIVEGHYHEEVPYSQREDEIGQLQNHFLQMQQSLAGKSDELEQLTAMLTKRSEELQKAYGQTKGSDRMKTTFLHYMTNQMTIPSDAIDRSITTLCNNYRDISIQEVEHNVDTILQQSNAIIDVLDRMLHTADNESGKERDNEEKEVAHE
jgi:methyl-accepting chemotaxis protein/sigma-B regulation protein RsbU (phosphoserine phosphatase)